MQPDHTDKIATLHFIKGQLLFEYIGERGATIRKCISPESARQAFLQQHFDSGWIAPHTIRHGEGPKGPWALQHYPAARYTLHFDRPLAPTRDTTMQLTLPLPSLLFLGVKRRYYLFAYRAWNDGDTTLYHAPLSNVAHNGQICYGNATPPAVTPRAIAAAWELFWRADFNEDHASGKSRAHPENIVEQLLNVAGQQSTTYPLTDLKRADLTVAGLIEQINHNEG